MFESGTATETGGKRARPVPVRARGAKLAALVARRHQTVPYRAHNGRLSVGR